MQHHTPIKPVVDGLQIWQRRGMPDATPKLLLCRPQGGLNDILSEIGKCIKYGRRFNRKVYVETDYHGSNHFNDDFAYYFQTTDQTLILDGKEIIKTFDPLPVVPHFIQGRVNTYRSLIGGTGIDEATRQAITFDFSRNHNENILLHHANGQLKGRNALIALSCLRVSEELSEKLKVRQSVLGSDYSAIHIRHTDYKTDYQRRLQKIAPKIMGRIFVATDNREVLDYCKTLFGAARVFSFSHLPEDDAEPLHHSRRMDGMRQRNTDAILDLFTLALARRYFFFRRISTHFHLIPRYSGFSVLAERLRHEPRLLHKVITGEDNKRLGVGGVLPNTWRQIFGR
jgi:hypothetical protein